MKKGRDHKNYLQSVRADNKKRLRNLGLPTDLFREGFWEGEAEAKKRELLLLVLFEGGWRSGDWQHLSLPFEEIIERWRAEIANPLHFASLDARPRWVRALTCAASDWRRHSNGSYRKSWREYRRKQIAQKREAEGKPPSKWRA